MSIYIGLVFWCIYIINKNLIILHHIPLWLCHLCHTFTLFFALIELVTSRRSFPNQKLGVSILTLFTGSYVIWIHIVYFWTGVWAYPFLKVFPLPLKILWNLGSVLGGIVFYFVGEKLNSLVWDNSESKRLWSLYFIKKRFFKKAVFFFEKVVFFWKSCFFSYITFSVELKYIMT